MNKKFVNGLIQEARFSPSLSTTPFSHTFVVTPTILCAKTDFEVLQFGWMMGFRMILTIIFSAASRHFHKNHRIIFCTFMKEILHNVFKLNTNQLKDLILSELRHKDALHNVVSCNTDLFCWRWWPSLTWGRVNGWGTLIKILPASTAAAAASRRRRQLTPTFPTQLPQLYNQGKLHNENNKWIVNHAKEKYNLFIYIKNFRKHGDSKT